MRRFLAALRDRRGGAAIETAIVAPFLFTGVIGIFDLGLYLFNWNQAVEAARVGARIAAVSDPVAPELATMTGLETGVESGEPAGDYERLCTGAASSCSGGGYSAAAFSRIFHGPGSTGCGDATRAERRGMCDAFTGLRAAQVTIRYQESGADTAGVPGALRPLISVRVAGVPSGAVILGTLVPGAFATLPAVETTVLAEDLRSAGG